VPRKRTSKAVLLRSAPHTHRLGSERHGDCGGPKAAAPSCWLLALYVLAHAGSCVIWIVDQVLVLAEGSDEHSDNACLPWSVRFGPLVLVCSVVTTHHEIGSEPALAYIFCFFV
jgi:hypothetical protein